MRGWRWVRWAVNMPNDSERLCAWLTRRYRLTGVTNVSTSDALRMGPIRRVRLLDPVLRELTDAGALRVWRRGRGRWIMFEPAAIREVAAEAKALFPDLYCAPICDSDPAAAYMLAVSR